MRIITGAYKGRRLDAPTWDGLRPTSDKLRETLFNVLGPSIDGIRFLDGYAGTGAVGIEALSRGAAHVTFVESDRRASGLVQANLDRCGVKERYAIIRVDFARAAAALSRERFDVIFLDPPYGPETLAAALTAAGPIALASQQASSNDADAADGMPGRGVRVIIEHAKRDAAPDRLGPLTLTRRLASGYSALAFYDVA